MINGKEHKYTFVLEMPALADEFLKKLKTVGDFIDKTAEYAFASKYDYIKVYNATTLNNMPGATNGKGEDGSSTSEPVHWQNNSSLEVQEAAMRCLGDCTDADFTQTVTGVNFTIVTVDKSKVSGKIVASETCMVGDKDFRTQLARIKSANPEAVYIPNYTVEDAQILEQGAQLGVGPYLSSDGFSDPMIYQLAGDYTDGVVYVGPAQAEASTILTDFQAAYRNAYNGDEADSFATNSYDALYILADSIERAGAEADRDAVRDQVEATKDFLGANGTINFASNGDLVASQGVYDVEGTTPVYVGAFQVQNGQIVQVD